ncbi:UNVERIFIED_ORG: hypothetical protein ABIC54_006619 [Burkholderia sp. 1263]
MEKALPLYMVVSWRIARLMRLGRTCPELEASRFFAADEIHGAHVLSKKPRPKKPPTLNQMIRMIASLGGFPGRKSDGEPGAKTLWIAMQRGHGCGDHHPDLARRLRHFRIGDAFNPAGPSRVETRNRLSLWTKNPDKKFAATDGT